MRKRWNGRHHVQVFRIRMRDRTLWVSGVHLASICLSYGLVFIIYLMLAWSVYKDAADLSVTCYDSFKGLVL